MKRAFLVLMALLLLSTISWAANPVGGPPPAGGQEVTMTGMLSCTFCNMPGAGKCSKECCQACIKSGDPALLTDDKGQLYILLSGEHEKPLMTPEKMNLVTEKVTVTGMMVKRGGLQGIYVKKMEKAK
jgi:hypothetical protein